MVIKFPTFFYPKKTDDAVLLNPEFVISECDRRYFKGKSANMAHCGHGNLDMVGVCQIQTKKLREIETTSYYKIASRFGWD